MESMPNFRLKELRKARGITQLKLAMDLNMSQNTISRYENGQREAGYAELMLFAIILMYPWITCFPGHGAILKSA